MKSVYHPTAARRVRVRRPRWSPYRYTRWWWHVLFGLIDGLGWLAFGPAKLFLAAVRPAGRGRTVNSLLVVQLDHLGDAVMSLGLLEALRERFPAARLHVLTAPWNDELLASCGSVDHVHVMNVTRFSRQGGLAWLAELVRWGWRLRRHHFDLAIDVRGEFPHAVLLWLSGARRRVGWACGGGGFLLSDRVRYVPGRHEVLSRAAIADQLGIGPAEMPPSRIEPAQSALRWAEEQFSAAWRSAEQGQQPGPIIAIHVGTGMAAKRWPAESWRDLADRLFCQRNARIVLVGTRQDHEAAELIAGSNVASAGLRPLNLVGCLSLPKLAAVLRRAHLFIGADSGPAHVAAAVGTPVLALFSGTNDPRQWTPWGTLVVVLRHAPTCSPCHRETCAWADHPCMRGITPQMVAGEATQMLERGSAGTASRVGCAHQAAMSRSESPLSVAPADGPPTKDTARGFWWAQPTLRWLLAGWMATVAAAYLCEMLIHRGW